MDILYNNQLINQIVQKLFKHRRSEYSEFNLDNLLENLDIEHQIIKVMNPTYQKLYGSLFKRNSKPEICIIFFHGYGSNRLQCSNLLKSLNQNYALCSFDFSGSGKSEGDRITYGAKQKQDINSIIIYLRQAGFKKFVLWGRSMGATSSLLYCIKYNPKDVILQIIDSPFYSFQMIAFQIAQKNVKAPQFIINFAIQLAKKNCSKFINNPFDIELNNVDKCKIPALFVYSQQDNVINSKNTHLICSKYKSIFQKLVIQENHNTIRHQNTISKIYQYIQKYALKSKPRLVLQYKQFQINNFDNNYFSNPSKKIKQRLQKKKSEQFSKSISKRGIQRVSLENNFKLQIDDYGFTRTDTKGFFNQKLQISPQPSKLYGLQSNTPSKRPYLSLTSSFDSKNSRESNSAIKRHDFKSIIAEDTPSIYQIYSKYPNDPKSKMKKKISTVKSIGGSRCLDNAKYLD